MTRLAKTPRTTLLMKPLRGYVTKRQPVWKKPYQCIDGPLSGTTLMLTDGFTGVISIHGQTGRYADGGWQHVAV